MGKNLIREEFLSDGTWVCPAAVTQIRVVTETFLFNQMEGSYSSCAIDSNRNAYTWGGNTNGQLATGDVVPRSIPTLINSSLKWRGISSATGDFNVGVTQAGDAYAWGLNANGNLGIGNVTSQSIPVLVLGSLKWRQISCGTDSGYGIDSNANAYGWGINANGQLGVGDVVPRSSPVLIVGSIKWRQIFGGQSFNMLGIDNSGNGWGMGFNTNGQLGIGNVTPQSSPIMILGSLKWKLLAAGSASLGIDQFQNAYAWGFNASGQLGTGTITPASSPILVLGGFKWRYVTAGGNGATDGHCMGIDLNGNGYAWGSNVNGELGIGSVLAQSSPILILGGLKWSRLFAGSNHASFGIDSLGNAYAWGLNTNGGLGIGNVIPQSSPILISGSLKWQSAYNAMVNMNFVTVVPGVTYSIQIFEYPCSFDYISQYQDPYNSGAMPLRMYIEYEA